jgi:hypothetical protein
MRVVLIIEDDGAVRRRIADGFLRAGYGVCETHSSDLVPAVPRLDAVISDTAVAHERFRAPIVPIPAAADVDELLASVQLAVSAPGERAA